MNSDPHVPGSDLRRWIAGSCLAAALCAGAGYLLGGAGLEHHHRDRGGLETHRHVHCGPHRHAPRVPSPEPGRSPDDERDQDERYLPALCSAIAHRLAAVEPIALPEATSTVRRRERPALARPTFALAASPRGPPV